MFKPVKEEKQSLLKPTNSLESQMEYRIKEDQKKEYVSGVLLDMIITQDKKYSVLLEGDDKDLEPLFSYMMSKDYLELDSSNCYAPSEKGREKLDNLQKRYKEYLAHFDIYCAVDLEEGCFAFERFFEMDDSDWGNYIAQDRWADVRIAVAEFKKMNPADIVFLTFLNEGIFSSEKKGWQFDLLSGLIWDQIEEIIENSICIEELAYQLEDGTQFSGENVIIDIIAQGSELNAKLHQQETELRREEQGDDEDGDEEEYVTTTYESYYDPFYVSPIWFLF